MENKKNINLFTLVTGILLAVSAIINISLIISAVKNETEVRLLMSFIANTLVAAFGSIYAISGAKKETGGPLLKIYFDLCLVATLFLFTLPQTETDVFADICYAFAFAGFAILAVASDLGEVKSKIIAVVIVLAKFIPYLYKMISSPDFEVSGFNQLSSLVISLSVLVLICAKYEDKTERGTK